MAGIDITALAASLGAYHRQRSKELYSTMMQRDHELKIFKTIAGVKDEYVVTETQLTEMIQAYQKAWTPKGDVKFIPNILKTRRVKVDTELNPVDLEKTWEGERIDGSLPEGQELLEGYIFGEITKRIRKDIRKVLINGQFVAPTPGTAGAAINSFDGILTQYLALLTLNYIDNVVHTGPLTKSNIREQVEETYDSVDEDFKEEDLIMLIGADKLRWYKRDYRSEFGANTDYAAPGHEMEAATIDGTNTKMIPIPAMNGKDQLIITTPDNIKRLIDGTGEDNDFNLRFQVNRRVIEVLGDFKMGTGFLIGKGLVWGNDASPL